ncbi:hypothetical protein ACLB1G_07455 [Oxalobacteraceae bacterium A2-2]
MNTKSIYYSCSTWLAYEINQRFYGGLHYVWCTPYFDPTSSLNPSNSIPPTSSPRDIYWRLKKEVECGDLHSAKISSGRARLRHGAYVRLQSGLISTAQHDEICDIVQLVEIADFRPLLLVIPGAPVATLLKPVAVRERANPLSEEYIIEDLPRALFDAIEL